MRLAVCTAFMPRRRVEVMYAAKADQVEPTMRATIVNFIVTALASAEPAASNHKDAADHGKLFLMRYGNMSRV